MFINVIHRHTCASFCNMCDEGWEVRSCHLDPPGIMDGLRLSNRVESWFTLPLTSCHSHLALPRMQAFPSFKEGLYRNACVKRVKAGNPGALGSASVDSSVSSVVHKQLPVSESFEANSPSGVGGGHGAIATVASVKAVLEGVESMKLDSRGDGSAKERSRKGVLDDPTSHSGKEFSSSSSPASPLELPMIRA